MDIVIHLDPQDDVRERAFPFAKTAIATLTQGELGDRDEVSFFITPTSAGTARVLAAALNAAAEAIEHLQPATQPSGEAVAA
jgi:hypothetical protein